MYFRAHADLQELCFAVANLQDGVDMYSIPNMQLLNSFKHSSMNDHVFKVALIDGTRLVSGGQDDAAHLFDCWRGSLVTKLDHSSCKSFIYLSQLVLNLKFHSWGILTDCYSK